MSKLRFEQYADLLSAAYSYQEAANSTLANGDMIFSPNLMERFKIDYWVEFKQVVDDILEDYGKGE